MNDLPFVLRAVDLLEDARLRVWLFGGWAEELRGLRAPCEHVDVDFLYPGRDFARVDALFERAAFAEVEGKQRPHKRAFMLEGTLVELLLVQKDSERLVLRAPAWAPRLAGGRVRERRPAAGRERRGARGLPALAPALDIRAA